MIFGLSVLAVMLIVRRQERHCRAQKPLIVTLGSDLPQPAVGITRWLAGSCAAAWPAGPCRGRDPAGGWRSSGPRPARGPVTPASGAGALIRASSGSGARG